MTADFATQATNPSNSPSLAPVNPYSQIRLKGEGQKLLLILPPEAQTEANIDWPVVWQEFKHRLQGSQDTWQPGKSVHLVAQNHLLDGRQLQAIAETLAEVKLQLRWVCTSRRQTAVAAATAGYCVEQILPPNPLTSASELPSPELAEPLYLKTTVRSGVEVRHPGTVVLLGDVNPGGTIVASGDILIWGRLRGVAHAGAQGNPNCRIMALRLEATQVRIADAVARVPDLPPEQGEPEVAYLTPEGIRLSKGIDPSKKPFAGWKSSES